MSARKQSGSVSITLCHCGLGFNHIFVHLSDDKGAEMKYYTYHIYILSPHGEVGNVFMKLDSLGRILGLTSVDDHPNGAGMKKRP